MSDLERGNHPEESPPKKIGYGNPPEKHQFKKGKSGNPKGRPKKAKHKKPEPDAYTDTKIISKLLRSESNRTLKVKDGGKVEEITVLEATIRSLGVAAMKGSRLAQRDLIKLAQDEEKTRQEDIAKKIEKIAEYRFHYPDAMKVIQHQGITEENFLHHPDDMIINPETGEIDINGPFSAEEQVRWYKLIADRDAFASSVTYIAEGCRAANDDQEREGLQRLWVLEQKSFDILNDNLPRRYRSELAHRSVREGASQPGDQRTRHWPGE